MSKKEKARQELLSLLGTGVSLKDREKALGRMKKLFAGLDPEDQVETIEAIAAHAGADPAALAALIAGLIDQAGVSLPARIKLLKLQADRGQPVDPADVPRLERWLDACEADDAECDAEEFFLLPPTAQAAIADHLALWLKTELLVTLRDAATDKDAKRRVAKAIHRAKSAGAVALADAGVGARFVMAGKEDEHVDEALLAPPDANGVYVVYFYKTIRGKNALFVGVLSDHVGFIRLETYDVSKPSFEKILESTRDNPHAILIKIDPAYLRFMVKRAEEEATKLGIRQPDDFLANRRALGVADQGEVPHPLWSRLDRDETKAARGLVLQSDRLADVRVFEGWRIEPDLLGAYIVELKEIRNSPIELSPAAQNQRELELYEKAARQILDRDGRDHWRDRLLNAALVLHVIGDPENAKIAAAIGLALDDPNSPPPPFFVQIVRRTIEADLTADDQPKPGPDINRGGIIV